MGDKGVAPDPHGAWTTNRLEIARLLSEKDGDAAQLYATAIDALREQLTRIDLMIVGHCVRELVKILPAILGYPTIEHADASRAARELHREWSANDLPLADEDGNDPARVSIPASVYAAARVVAKAGADGARNSRALTSQIVTGLSTGTDTAPVVRVHSSIERFRRWAHARDYTAAPRPLPPRDRVLAELELIEEALMNRLGNMADRSREIWEMLDRINTKSVGEGE